MNRENILAVRLTEVERATAERLAVIEKLPLSTLVRRSLLQQAERQGIWPPLNAQVTMADAHPGAK